MAADFGLTKRIIIHHFSTVQAIYLFGSIDTDDEWPDSDIDIAILLLPADAKRQAV
ncbi:MAG: nucleotidyltransferase domain-containing protein [Anaerolineales bacterium]|nr:nucleotidyltransferase domain-containing protein [Anaerolineales bacterium]